MPTPPTAPRHPVSVLRHGELQTDDFAWLRDRDNAETIAYLEAENRYAESVMAPTKPLQELLYREMLGRIKETDLSVPVRRDGYWYYSRTEEGKQYATHCRRRGSMEDGAEEILLDVNALAEGKPFMALGNFAVSDDASFLAYSTDETGFRQYTLVVKDLRSNALLPFSRPRVTSVAWTIDGRELYYTVEDEVTKRSHQLWRHEFGRSEDTLVFEEHDEAFSVHVGRTRSRAWLILQSSSHTTSECRVLPARAASGEWQLLLARVAEIEYDVEHHGREFLIRINDTGRNFRLVRAPMSDVRHETFEEILPHRDDVMLEEIDCFEHWWVATERRGGVPELAVHAFDEGEAHTIEFPEPVREAYLHVNPEWDTDTIRIGYQSLVTPASVYDYNITTRERTLLKQQEVVGGFDGAPSCHACERNSRLSPRGVWFIRISISGDFLVQSAFAPRARNGGGHRAHPGRWGARQGLARRRPDVEQDEHLHRFHRSGRTPDHAERRGPGSRHH